MMVLFFVLVLGLVPSVILLTQAYLEHRSQNTRETALDLVDFCLECSEYLEYGIQLAAEGLSVFFELLFNFIGLVFEGLGLLLEGIVLVIEGLACL